MESLLASAAVRIALAASGAFFMTGLLTGVWKYACMRRSPTAKAPFYVSTAHRAALMYAFAAQLLAVFSAVSIWPALVNTVAVILPLLFFVLAITHYIQLGLTTDSDNSLRDSPDRAKDYTMLNLLTVAEIGGTGVLLLGFFGRLLS